uniref:ATP synthase epsilon chain, chloroplastic n=1 Tax=Microrhizoidea pickettheapsiorum TaxID=2604950 RepID=A0A5B9RIA3_9CHLO|nr:ATP synthase CF1 subunit epsilon [Microrhizoidea pickettheapsiorum]QEG77703.1 ATP synthase CF1 subunit epsilon [Microrhizoidea pickettheapsiorum]
MSLDICIMAPDRIFLETEAEEVILPTNTGQIGILSSHSPLLSGLDIGIMLLREKNDWESIALMGGFALIKDNKVTILVNDAENALNIKKEEAEQNFNEARSAFEKAVSQKEKIETNLALKRAKVRYQISS